MTYILQAGHVKAKPVKYKIDFMKVKMSECLSNAPENTNLQRTFSLVRNNIREILSRERNVQLLKKGGIKENTSCTSKVHRRGLI